MRHPDDYPKLAVIFNSIPSDISDTAYDKPPIMSSLINGVSNLELGLLVGFSLFGLGVLIALGMLELPINPFK